ncbi:ABCB family ABC transporter ATP-binding protein/permease [Leptospira sp. GIMC2001]|uniref:ABCB family ABC transporter ATP-binding protein/permease n=1 Tax=Leptospira sp. GIMC2001 TaxID=1513297 RepID=UPI00234BAF70|nr:ABC transporter ATP-binding protein/permease [Leptospira sp. GIMC2001]WCL49362.1 ABC transporter ATP-binding protein/permease [Leptospira sp. GIMC2001]
MKSLLPYLLEHKFRVLVAILFLILAKLATVMIPFILKDLVDDLDSIKSSYLMISLPVGLLVTYGLLRFANVMFGEIRDTLFGRITERAMHKIGLKVFEHVHNLDLEFHLNRSTGGLSRDIERGVSGISFLLRFMVFNIVPVILEIAMVIGILIINYSIWFAIITLIAIILYITYSVIVTDWRIIFIREANKADSESNSRAVDSLLNYETVKYFSNEKYEVSRYDEDLEKWETARRKNRLSLFVVNGGQALIVSLAMTAIMILAAINVINATMTLGDFVLMNAFMMQLFIPLNLLGFVYREIKGSLTNIEKMFQLLDQKPSIKDEPNCKDLEIREGRIKFESVRFHYDANRTILQNVNFEVLPKQKLAVVGSSGSGKSTIVKLLFRFYDVNEGCISIDGQDIRNISQSSLRKSIGIVPQDTVLFNTTILENIRYGRIDSTMEEIWDAIRLAHLEDFILSLPNQLETIVGERGLKLSGGEKQRIAIARTILKRPHILVFDEATSSLDSQSEQFVLKAIAEVSKGQTSLVIAHRLSTIVDSDAIIVLEQGKIVETGTHDSLIQMNSVYANLWRIQQKENKVESKI